MKQNRWGKPALIAVALLTGIAVWVPKENNKHEAVMEQAEAPSSESTKIELNAIPDYEGKPYVVINDNQPYFTEELISDKSYETYYDLDDLGRCTGAVACVGTDIMPTEERGPIGEVKPTGWHLIKYDFVDGKYLYNRCHLLGFQLTGENANHKNLITGTRYLNVDGMLPFENEVANYVEQTNHHVLYRVTPIFTGDNLLANGVLMEAKSMEDDAVVFCVYCYNVQPGVMIDYATGDSWIDENSIDAVHAVAREKASSHDSMKGETTEIQIQDFVLNTNTKKLHTSSCPNVKGIKEKNRQDVTGTLNEMIAMGYEPCKNCLD